MKYRLNFRIFFLFFFYAGGFSSIYGSRNLISTAEGTTKLNCGNTVCVKCTSRFSEALRTISRQIRAQIREIRFFKKSCGILKYNDSERLIYQFWPIRSASSYLWRFKIDSNILYTCDYSFFGAPVTRK